MRATFTIVLLSIVAYLVLRHFGFGRAEIVLVSIAINTIYMIHVREDR